MIIKMTSEANAVLALVKEGRDNAQIAKEIGASVEHVDFVVTQLKIYAFI